MGQTLNVMTLGGLALAVGILVDDATVEIENIHRNLGQRKPLVRAILDGAQQIAMPAFVSTLSICIVFVPVVFLTGAVQSLFTPLALGVVVAMLASYLLSRTLVPTMVQYLLRSELYRYREEEGGHRAPSRNLIWNLHYAFNRGFERFRHGYRRCLDWALRHRLAQIDTLRVYVNVPQTFMSTIQPGQNAQLMVRELPQQAFMGKVVRTASALEHRALCRWRYKSATRTRPCCLACTRR
jgi:multidrug efflux pump subunit AcrB